MPTCKSLRGDDDPIPVTLRAAAATADTDFTAKLVDVELSGCARKLMDDAIRVCYRERTAHPTLIAPEKVYGYAIALWATSHLFNAGHRIQVESAGSNFPRLARNPNAGPRFFRNAGLPPTAQKLLDDVDHPSHIVLPVNPR